MQQTLKPARSPRPAGWRTRVPGGAPRAVHDTEAGCDVDQRKTHNHPPKARVDPRVQLHVAVRKTLEFCDVRQHRAKIRRAEHGQTQHPTQKGVDAPQDAWAFGIKSEALRRHLLHHQEHSGYEAPQHKRPFGPVPQSAHEEDDQKVDVGANRTAPVAPQRVVEVRAKFRFGGLSASMLPAWGHPHAPSEQSPAGRIRSRVRVCGDRLRDRLADKDSARWSVRHA